MPLNKLGKLSRTFQNIFLFCYFIITTETLQSTKKLKLQPHSDMHFVDSMLQSTTRNGKKWQGRRNALSSHSLSTWTPMKCGWNDTCKTQEDPASSFRKLRKFKVNKISKAPPPNQLLSLVSLSSKKC